MPYHGAELQAYRCNKWAKENGYLYDPNGDALIKVRDGYEVATPLPDDETDVFVTDFGANGLRIEVRKSSMPNPYGNRKRCKTAEEAIAEFTSTPDDKSSRKCKANDTAVLPECVTEKATRCNRVAHDEADTSVDNVITQDAVFRKQGSEKACHFTHAKVRQFMNIADLLKLLMSVSNAGVSVAIRTLPILPALARGNSGLMKNDFV